jgi:O-antigen ligase
MKACAFGFLVLFLSFIYLDPQLRFPILAVIRAALVLATVGVVCAALGGGRLRFNGTTVALVMLLAFAVLSTFTAIHFDIAVTWFVVLLKSVALYVLVVMSLNTKRSIRYFVYANVVYGAVVGVTSLLMTRAGVQPLKGGGLYRMTNYFGGLGDDSNEFGALMVALIPVATLLAGTRASKMMRTLLAVIALSFALVAIRTRSRGAFLALGIVGVQLVWALRRSRTALAVIACGLIYAGTHTHMGYWDRMLTLTRPDDLEEEVSAGTRVAQQGYTLELMRLRPLTGVGPGNFVPAKRELLNADPSEKATGYVAHNAYLGLGAQLGIPALLAWIAALGLTLRRLARASNRAVGPGDQELQVIARALRISLLGMAVAIFFLSEEANPILYMWMGLGTAIERLATLGAESGLSYEPVTGEPAGAA